jgi:hypothetical protein
LKLFTHPDEVALTADCMPELLLLGLHLTLRASFVPLDQLCKMGNEEMQALQTSRIRCVSSLVALCRAVKSNAKHVKAAVQHG